LALSESERMQLALFLGGQPLEPTGEQATVYGGGSTPFTVASGRAME
jgi:hypothetical protein